MEKFTIYVHLNDLSTSIHFSYSSILNTVLIYFIYFQLYHVTLLEEDALRKTRCSTKNARLINQIKLKLCVFVPTFYVTQAQTQQKQDQKMCLLWYGSLF